MESNTPAGTGGLQLALEVLRQFGLVRLKVTGSSMLPAILPGDVLTLERCEPAVVGVGELVAFEREGNLVVHRLVERQGDFLLTQGDALPRPDDLVPAANVRAKVARVERRRRTSVPPPRSGWLLQAGRQLFGRSRLATRLFLRMHSLSARAFA